MQEEIMDKHAFVSEVRSRADGAIETTAVIYDA